MALVNTTKDESLHSRVKICSNVFCMSIGLLGTLSCDKALVFSFSKERKPTFHMFFMLYSIDILFLDSEKRVVDVKEDFKPFTVYASDELVRYAVELPVGTVSETGTEVGDELSWE